MKIDERMYRIACSFPALRAKGVSEGEIPGITPTGFYDERLSDFLYKDSCWSHGEFLAIEFLLNFFNPYHYKKFNFGMALNTWDNGQLKAFIEAILESRK